MDGYFGSLFVNFVLGLTTLILLYWYSKRNHGYWKKKHVRFVKPLPLFGNMLDTVFQPPHELEKKRYKEHGTIYGFYEGNNPVLSVSEPEILRCIFQKDFFSFPTRRKFQLNGTVLEHNVSILEGEDWRRVRSVISPTFSTGKLKKLIQIIKERSQTLTQNVKNAVLKKEKIELKRLFETYIMDVIASSAFSMEIDSRNDPDNRFVKSARAMFTTGGFNWRFMINFLAPRLSKFLRISLFDPEAERFFRFATYHVIEERKKSGQVRNDYLQLLIDATKSSAKDEKTEEDIASNYVVESSSDHIFSAVKNKYLTMNEMIGQCALFFVAGYEAPAATLAYAMYELALHEDVQEKLRQEIDDVLLSNKGELTYDVIQNMKYLDNVISETFRMYPAASTINRVADTDYTLGDTGITVPKGILVSVPVYAIHMDPKYFPQPEKFDPDRFNPEERSKMVPYTYYPFGAGPRNCVGMRFALLEVKVCLVYMLANFTIKKGLHTKVPLEFRNGPMFIQAKETIVDFKIRSSSPLKG